MAELLCYDSANIPGCSMPPGTANPRRDQSPGVAGVSEINTHLDVAGVFKVPTPLPIMSKSTQRFPTAADTSECLFHRPLALHIAHVREH